MNDSIQNFYKVEDLSPEEEKRLLMKLNKRQLVEMIVNCNNIIKTCLRTPPVDHSFPPKDLTQTITSTGIKAGSPYDLNRGGFGYKSNTQYDLNRAKRQNKVGRT